MRSLLLVCTFATACVHKPPIDETTRLQREFLSHSEMEPLAHARHSRDFGDELIAELIQGLVIGILNGVSH